MDQGDATYDATIRWTSHGVAHVEAGDWGSLGFGQGYGCARDNLGILADQFVKVRGERALFHGPGPADGHLASDFGYRVLGLVERAPALRDAQPEWIRRLVAGYAAGYNARLADARRDGRMPAWCAEAPWLRPIDELDLYAYLGDVILMASGRNVAGILGRAEAPGPDGPVPASPVEALGTDSAASNGWALGRDVTASGHGIVLANPHFPWYGEARFWECHLTLPGELDVYGAALLGVPGVQMGFNEHVGWAHTFSKGHRFTMYRLDLVDGSPTRYRFGDEERAMTPSVHRVDVRTDEGVRTVERTLWRTHHGPMVNLPLLGWGLDTGFCYRDANLANTGVFEQFLGMDRAGSLDELEEAFARHQAMPWVNTLASDATGRVWYSDASATPALSDAAAERYRVRVREDFVAALLLENRVALLDGSEPDDDWLDLPGAPSPGLLPHDRLPQVERTDWVANANDSHWLPHPHSRLEGYSPLHGLERTALSLRTRQNLSLLARLAEAGDVTVHDVLDALFANESLSADLLLDDVVAACAEAGSVTVGERTVDVASAAAVLAAWDRRFDLASRGAVLWREVVAGAGKAAWTAAGALFAEDFDLDDPVGTPRGLASAGIPELVAAAVVALESAGLDAEVPLGAAQWADVAGRRVPLHGGSEGDGIANVVTPVGGLASASLQPVPAAPAPVPGRHATTGLAQGGYQITYGSSFVMAVELTDEGPVGFGLLAYGNDADAPDPHDEYAAKAVRPLLFRREDIDADPELVVHHVTG